MNNQACEPCARRKVRCDKQQPCSNCKRRKQDQCTYPEAAPADRVKRLESLVRSLGGDPNSDGSRTPKRAKLGPSLAETQIIDRDAGASTESERGQPILVEQDGQSYYVEMRAWHSHLGLEVNQQNEVNHDVLMSRPLISRTKPDALQGLLRADYNINLALQHPSVQDANFLWDRFERNANPLIKIDFDWALKGLRATSTDIEGRTSLKDPEHTFLFCLYLMSIVSIPEEECTKILHQPKHVLLSHYQAVCEQALSRSNIFCIADVIIIRALILYMASCAASIERLSIRSLFSLMGLTIRNAEALGIHRDGAILRLNPVETESRRRLWWHLQHLDLALGVRCGTTPLTLMAGWDANVPLNVEDSDLNPDMTEAPAERKGLTSLSYCLWTYWIVSQQREFFSSNRGKLGISWASNKSLPHATKISLINTMEEGLNKKFLQYCDPIKSLDILVQLTSRALICTMRMFTLHPMSFSGDANITDEQRHAQLVEAAIKSLEYNIALNSRPEIQRFQWFINGYFQWHAFISVIVEVMQLKGSPEAQRIWDLLSDLYTYNKNLLELSEDRRKLHAAELITSAWKARQTADPSAYKPACVSILEPLLSDNRGDATKTQTEVVGQPLEPVMTDEDLDTMLDLEFQDIDWGFWAGME
ncbi:hypothetical protein D6D15_05457 [Aureobasidium pullulans]|uniref:Zn(2)-C6 fungal-type domain-containing protein n=1 Tax=Aureobasidium pullulans TaxID=5580 RepID=A0A4S9B8D0_AURPU|nr:hypothetical protein D6D15_05457 [Aureobasidium pullulans]